MTVGCRDRRRASCSATGRITAAREPSSNPVGFSGNGVRVDFATEILTRTGKVEPSESKGCTKGQKTIEETVQSPCWFKSQIEHRRRCQDVAKRFVGSPKPAFEVNRFWWAGLVGGRCKSTAATGGAREIAPLGRALRHATSEFLDLRFGSHNRKMQRVCEPLIEKGS